MTDTTITVSRRDANHAAFALRMKAQKWRKIAAAAAVTEYGGSNGFTLTLTDQADAVDRVAQAIEDQEDA